MSENTFIRDVIGGWTFMEVGDNPAPVGFCRDIPILLPFFTKRINPYNWAATPSLSTPKFKNCLISR